MPSRWSLVLVVLAVVLAAACGADDDGAATTTTGTGSSGGSTTTTEPPRPPTVEELLAGERVLNIAHAGGDQDAPHSTMYAFREAVDAGADVLELDVRTTADGVVVVHHDADTAKTTPEALVVSETDLATLLELDKAYWFSPECWPCHGRPVEEYVFRGVSAGDTPPPEGYGPEDFRMVTFEELHEAFPAVPFDIEIKGEAAEGVHNAEVLAAELRRLGRADSSVVGSFESEVIAAFHDAAPEVATSPGAGELTGWLLGDEPLADHHVVIQVPPTFEGVEVLTPDSVAQAHDDGLDVWAWMDSPREQENEAFYRSLIDLGVDGLVAGRPATAEAAIVAAGS